MRDAHSLFALLTLEGMQAGLSWWTVLQKRERMHQQFFDFDPNKLANAKEKDLQGWLQDSGLIRHRGKLEAMINNAQAFLNIEDFADFIWSSVDYAPQVNRFSKLSQVPGYTDAASALAKRLKKHGFKFVGPTTVYAFMQSAGLVNDHITSCPWHAICAEHADGFRW